MSNITHKWVNVLEPFSCGYKRSISASQISRETKVPQQTVSRILNNLVKETIVKYENEGKNKKFSLENNSLRNIVLNIIESSKTLEFSLKQRKISVILNEILKFCESLIVFGSYSSGKSDKKSDLDIVVISARDKTRINSLVEDYSVEVHIQFVSYSELNALIKKETPLMKEIIQNHIIYGDVSKVVEVLNE